MEFNHFDENGNAIMVDISDKKVSSREAVAKGSIKVNKDVFMSIVNKTAKKGDVLNVARVAGIMAVKKTAELIPMCHSLLITKASIDFELDEQNLTINAICTVKTDGKTGVEMEALQGVSTSLLTIYDMCKALDTAMLIKDIYVYKKSGGRRGTILNER